MDRYSPDRRDFFAGLAMLGYLNQHLNVDVDLMTLSAKHYADEMIKELDSTPST